MYVEFLLSNIVQNVGHIGSVINKHLAGNFKRRTFYLNVFINEMKYFKSIQVSHNNYEIVRIFELTVLHYSLIHV